MKLLVNAEMTTPVLTLIDASAFCSDNDRCEFHRRREQFQNFFVTVSDFFEMLDRWLFPTHLGTKEKSA